MASIDKSLKTRAIKSEGLFILKHLPETEREREESDGRNVLRILTLCEQRNTIDSFATR